MAFDPITGAFEIGGKLLDHFFPDPTARANAQLELEKLRSSGDLAVISGQAEINKAEASNTRLFVSGWRPAVGWTCAAGMIMQFVVSPICAWTATLSGHPVTLPNLDTGTLTTLLVGMLGLGSMRTIEKLNATPGSNQLD